MSPRSSTAGPGPGATQDCGHRGERRPRRHLQAETVDLLQDGALGDRKVQADLGVFVQFVTQGHKVSGHGVRVIVEPVVEGHAASCGVESVIKRDVTHTDTSCR